MENNYSQNIAGNGNIVNEMKQINMVIDKKRDAEDNLEAINRKLEDLNSELSKHKDSLDELVKKALTLEEGLKEGDPVKEKVKRCLKELSLISFQITGTANSLLQIFGLK
jgi:ABC-type transporter Mla subunit MlaD